jgi:hypothetical protein
MTIALGALLAKAPPNPNDVVGGWVAFLVVLAMGAAVVFLYFSLKKQLGKVNFEEQADGAGSGGPAGRSAQARDVVEPPGQEPAPDSGQQPDDRDRPQES